jgi:hypothetical protein
MHGRGGARSLAGLRTDPGYQRAAAEVQAIGMRRGDLPLYG